MLRARLTQLKNDKIVQARLKMETGAEGKATKINYYFINYKSFVNVIKYKLDLMRKRLETEERDATSRASFKCSGCDKTFTDLEVDQLVDFETGDFTCLYCGSPVSEDLAAMPKKDSRLMLARFNDQLQPLYDLLREVEGIKLSPEILDPQPVDINVIRGIARPNDHGGNEVWSGEATRSGGFAVEEARVDITIGDVDQSDAAPKKERPIWMTASTVVGANDDDSNSNQEALLEKVAQSSTAPSTSWSSKGGRKKDKDDDKDIMSVLLQHEKQITKDNTDAVKNLNANSQDSSGGDSSGDDDDEFDKTEIREFVKCDIAVILHVWSSFFPLSLIQLQPISKWWTTTSRTKMCPRCWWMECRIPSAKWWTTRIS